MKNKKAGVIIVTYNAEKYIQDCIASVIKTGYAHLKIVVIDNASSDNTIKILQLFGDSVEIITNKSNKGYAQANNQGLRYLEKQQCDYFILLNPDTVVSQDLIEELLKGFDSKGVGAVSPIITYHQNPQIIWYAGGDFNKIFFYTRHPGMNTPLNNLNLKSFTTDFTTGCCMMISNTALKQIGYLDEELGAYFEDVDYCLRLKEQRLKCLMVPKQLVTHRVSSATGNEGSNELSAYRAYYFARNPFFLMKDHAKGLQRILPFVGQLFLRLPYYLMRTILSRNLHAISCYIKGMKDGITFLLKKSL